MELEQTWPENAKAVEAGLLSCKDIEHTPERTLDSIEVTGQGGKSAMKEQNRKRRDKTAAAAHSKEKTLKKANT